MPYVPSVSDALKAPMLDVNIIDPRPLAIMSGATICASQLFDLTLVAMILS